MLLAVLFGCMDVKNPQSHDVNEEVITRVSLLLTDSTGKVDTVEWSDPENDGAPVVDQLVLQKDGVYSVDISFWNDASQPAEDITPEILDEGDEHQVFTFAPTFLEVEVLDRDVNDLPLGLEQEWRVLNVGEDTLGVALRHMPSEDGLSVKGADLDEMNLPGEWDVNVEFSIVIQE